MTSSIRWGSYTNVQAVASTDAIQRSEVALETVTVIAPAIAANANANVYQIKSPGVIKAIMSCRITKQTGDAHYADSQARTPRVTIDGTGKFVNIAVPGGAPTILNTDVIHLILAVGY